MLKGESGIKWIKIFIQDVLKDKTSHKKQNTASSCVFDTNTIFILNAWNTFNSLLK